jgi:hypothetical protein
MKDTFGNEIKVGDVVVIPFTPTYKPKSYSILKLGVVKSVGAKGTVVSYNDDSFNRTKTIKNGMAMALIKEANNVKVNTVDSDLSLGV